VFLANKILKNSDTLPKKMKRCSKKISAFLKVKNFFVSRFVKIVKSFKKREVINKEKISKNLKRSFRKI
jgi:hypothetical protein